MESRRQTAPATVLGLGGSTHDFATIGLFGDVITGVEDERLIGERYALNQKKPCSASISYVAPTLNGNPLIVANDVLSSSLHWLNEGQIQWVNHHYAHAASTFYPSAFRRAAILTVDGAGSKVAGTNASSEYRETTTLSIGDPSGIRTLACVVGERPVKSGPQGPFSNSVGSLYRIITEHIGFGFLQAGKTMALAAYGDDRYIDLIGDSVELLSQGNFTIDVHGKTGLLVKLAKSSKPSDFQRKASLAKACQDVTEKVLTHLLRHLQGATGATDLCIAGGVALNAVFNGQITTRTEFERVHVTHAPGDSGTALGAAIHGCLLTAGFDRTKHYFRPGSRHVFPGVSYHIPDEWRGDRLRHDEMMHRTAEYLHQGKIVAWFQDGAEFGPRALGNRSILAAPIDAAMRDRLNIRVKFREWYRPFATSILAEDCSKYFRFQGASPYMSFAAEACAGRADTLGAVLHIDGTSRLQTVEQPERPLLHELIRMYAELGGPPLLLNTSLNTRGQPIAETPYDAYKVFIESDIDVLVCGDTILQKT
jgi:carbamoyltransferase